MQKVSELILSQTDQIQFRSEKVDYTYDIRVFVPEGEIPPGGYSVYYVLDGNFYFQIARDVIKLQSRNAPKTHVDPAIVIGIGHQDSDCSQKRFHDFTAFAEEYRYPPRLKAKGADLGPHGGAENFLAFIEEELKPYVKMHYSINDSKQCLFGHSLSGYFTLWVKFTRPELFQAYLSSSPSIWWNDHELLMYAQKYAVNTTVAMDNNVFITVGGEEGFMVDDAEKLTQLLHKHQYPVEMYIALEENHASVVPSVMSRMFRFGCSQVKEG